jgi:uncharacterized damage-inducible protein DinB
MLEIVGEVLRTMNVELGRIEACLDLLTDEQIWTRLQPNVNSIGNLCVHLAGNEYQTIVSGIGQKPFIRERSSEFTRQGGYAKAELIALLRSVRSEADAVLAGLSEADMDRTVTIRYSQQDWNSMRTRGASEQDPSFGRKLLPLLLHTAEHYGYHTGQIVVFTKLLHPAAESLSGYRH